MGIGITINGPDRVLLDYFAVHPDFRGKGIGSAALAAIRRQYDGRGLFLEIESTNVDSPERDLRLRRKQFYLRAGLQEFHVEVRLFGVEMELLGIGEPLSFREYHSFYADNYSQWAADHIQPV